MKIVYRANDIIEAHIVAGMLRANGIEPHVGGHYLQGAVGDLAMDGFANVLVDEGDYESAISIVRDYEATDTGSEEADDRAEAPSKPWLA